MPSQKCQALVNLFLAGPLIRDGARKLVGFLLASPPKRWHKYEVAEVFGVSKETIFRHQKDAVEAGIMRYSGQDLMAADLVDMERIEELAREAARR